MEWEPCQHRHGGRGWTIKSPVPLSPITESSWLERTSSLCLIITLSLLCTGLLLPSAIPTWKFTWLLLESFFFPVSTLRGSSLWQFLVGLWCQTQWQHQPLIPGFFPSLGFHTGCSSQLGQAAVHSENSSFCHWCMHFQIFSAHCKGVSVHAPQWAMLKGRCPVIGWHGTVFIWLQLVGETSFPWPCRRYSRHGMKITTDVVEMPKHHLAGCSNSVPCIICQKLTKRGWQQLPAGQPCLPLDHISSLLTPADENTAALRGKCCCFSFACVCPECCGSPSLAGSLLSLQFWTRKQPSSFTVMVQMYW